MLPIENDEWEKRGPTLPIEFSRISFTRCGALTLVIDPVNKIGVPARFAISKRKEIDDAICDLRTREGTALKILAMLISSRTPLTVSRITGKRPILL